MKKNKLFYFALVISIITFAANIILFPHMPNRIPIHWGVNGEPNGYGTRLEQIGMGALPLVILLLMNYLPNFDPKRESYKNHANAYSIINFIIIMFIACMNMTGLLSALGYNMPFQKIVPVLLGILFIVLGNYMTQIRHNYFVGFRTPWALASEYVWKKTHRFGGYIFVIIGLIPLTTFFIGTLGMYLFVGALLLGIVVVYLYSYLVFKRNGAK